MQLGVMNDPRLNACDEARWAADNGFAFLDLTVEGPGAALEQIDIAAMRSILNDTGLHVVGHTAWYLPFGSPVPRLRQAAIDSVTETFDMFATLGAKWVNVHIARGGKLFNHEDIVRWNGESFAQIAEHAVPYGLNIMVEHPANPEFKVTDICTVLNSDMRLGFHLDVGHAYVGGDRLSGLLKALGSRLVHVHLSDNQCRQDDHLPLGTGRINWPEAIRLIKQTGYDDTVTLEVFSFDRDYLLLSAKKVREWWDADPQEPTQEPQP